MLTQRLPHQSRLRQEQHAGRAQREREAQQAAKNDPAWKKTEQRLRNSNFKLMAKISGKTVGEIALSTLPPEQRPIESSDEPTAPTAEQKQSERELTRADLAAEQIHQAAQQRIDPGEHPDKDMKDKVIGEWKAKRKVKTKEPGVTKKAPSRKAAGFGSFEFTVIGRGARRQGGETGRRKDRCRIAS